MLPPKFLEPIRSHRGVDLWVQARERWPRHPIPPALARAQEHQQPQACLNWWGWQGNGIPAATPSRCMSLWKPTVVMEEPRSETNTKPFVGSPAAAYAMLGFRLLGRDGQRESRSWRDGHASDLDPVRPDAIRAHRPPMPVDHAYRP
jgi:hypothetical protein